MQKLNVGDKVVFDEKGFAKSLPHTILHIHQEPGDERCWFVCAYKGDIPKIKKRYELILHTAANPPVEEGLLRDLNLKPGDVLELVSFGESNVEDGYLLGYEGRKWEVDSWGKTVKLQGDRGHNVISGCAWVYRVVSRAKAAKYGDWKLGQAPRDLPWENLQVSRGPDGEIVAYRVKVEPEVKEVTLYGTGRVYGPYLIQDATHKITLTTIDGEPDCTSVKMEKL